MRAKDRSRILVLLVPLLFAGGLFGAAAARPALGPKDIPAPPAARETLDPKEILRRVDGLMRGDASTGTIVMSIGTAHWSRTLTIRFWAQGDDRSLMEILAPRKEQGTATLRAGGNIWNYLPRVGRVVRVPSAALGSSWLGSHFTYDDLVKDSRLAEDFAYEVTADEDRAGRRIAEITCLPKPEAPVVWARVVVLVDVAADLPLSILYYGEDEALARTLTFEDVGPIGGRTLPRRHRMVPAGAPGEFTEISYRDLVFDPALEDDLFTLRRLQR